MMDLYSHLMDIDEVVEYLNEKTNRNFTKDKTIKFIKEKKIPIVFEYEGWGTQEFQHKSGHQSLNIQVNGYFNFRNASDAIHIFKGFLKEINIDEAIIYQLDSYCIRSNAPDGIAPKEDDKILFKTGGRSPLFSNSNTPNFIKIDNDKVGVLKEDLEECLSKIQIEHMDNKTKIETLEFEIERLKNENASLIQEHTEVLTADDAKNEQQERDINRLNKQINKRVETAIPLERKAGISPEKQQAKEAAAIIARLLWEIETNKQTKMTDMCHQVYSKLHNSAFCNQLPDQPKSIKEWITGVAPQYASEAGRPSEK